MKITLCIKGLTKYAGGGAERSLTELANELVKRGYEVSILNGEENILPTDKVFYPIESKVELKTFCFRKMQKKPISNDFQGFINNRYLSLSINQNEYSIKFLIVRLTINVTSLKRLFNRIVRCFYKPIKQNEVSSDQLALWHSQTTEEISLWRENILEIRPKVVISFMVQTFMHVSEALTNSNISHIVVNRTDPLKSPLFYNEPVFKELIGKAIEKSRFNIILNESFKNYFDPRFHSKTVVIPNSISTITEKSTENRYMAKNFILSVGSYRAVKNHQLLIKAFYKICHNYPDWNVQIFGEDFGLKDELSNLVKTLDLEHRVFLNSPESQIHKRYQESKIFAFPSLYEGFSRALGEAMSFALPCLVIEDCVSNTDLVRNGGFGLVSKNDALDFSQKLEQLMNDADGRKQLGENALIYATQFAPEKIYNQWCEIIKLAGSSF